MNRYLLVAIAVIFGGFLAITASKQSQKAEPKAVNVSEIGANVSNMTGTITIAGIMGAVSNEDSSVIGIVDVKDVKELQCKNPGCQKRIIPVKCSGKRPSLGDEIRATGSFVKNGAGFVFAAEAIKVVRSHKI